MKIAVMGAGGVGGYFGGRLAAAGEDVSFIARGAHLAALRDHGLRVISPHGDLHIKPCRATDDPAAIGPVEVVLFATKLYGVEAAAEACRPLIGPDTAVISLQNGLDSEARMAPILGAGHVIGGVAQIGAAIEAPGVIRHATPNFATIQFGELPSGTSPRLQRFLAACQQAKVDAHLRDDIRRSIWDKFIFLAPLAGVCSLARQPAGPVRDNPETRALLRDAVAETVALARAEGIGYADDTVDGIMATIDGLPAGQRPSLLFDLEHGNRLEVDGLSGLVHRMSREKGLAAPVSRAVAAALAPYADGAPNP